MSLALGVLTSLIVLAVLVPSRASTPRPLAIPSCSAVPDTGDASRRWARRIAFGLLLAVAVIVAPPLAAGVVSVAALRRHRAARWAVHQRTRAVLAALPDTVDLLLLCAAAGWSLPLAHPVVAARAPPPLGGALADADAATAAGRPRADALLATLVPLGDRAAALAHVLVDHLRYGAPLVPGLERLGLELRLDRRRQAEEDARRLPVRLLGPLVTCILPAFALLTVVPLLAAALRSLPR